jgi:hypothetical protein
MCRMLGIVVDLETLEFPFLIELSNKLLYVSGIFWIFGRDIILNFGHLVLSKPVNKLSKHRCFSFYSYLCASAAFL